MATTLTAFGPEIWIARGPTVTAAGGFHYPTRMAVIRLNSGDLFVWSPTALSDDLRAAVAALGEVRHLVPPNVLHHVFLGDWQAAWPGARVYAPPGLRRKRADIRFDEDLGDAPVAAWAGEIDAVVMRGNLIATEIVFFHRESRTALFTDLIQHFRRGWFGGWRAVVARLDLMEGAVPAVPRKFRLAFADRRAARAALDAVLAWPAERLVMAHGEPVTEGARIVIADAFRWLRA
ncbi:DUF4336 domain-containing protein [Phreatobacter sp. AB_2022a]|uniref:DUF4336 domain-containing protein n=1 Tax=Phreatobacter sp. AB_2022a TaxID=3003134 RepID=UPI00228753DB|nr:DUF4336 domain-containing protein [Phreatobacter sp. AB_2022a]MCZ0733275.1 DUF4336 domain-containing protein [Phreatobacter sp. AB_2022a]